MNFKKFFEYDSASGILLMVSALLALIVNNIGLEHLYHSVLHAHMAIKIGDFGLEKSLGHWINDGLMTIFFLTVGLEIKRELVIGALREFKKALLPLIAALGGVILPALIYTAFNYGNPETGHGWGIPMATDIAFAVGVLSLLGKHVPRELKVMLLSLAIIDDLMAILVIAVFYTDHISMSALGYGAIAFAVLLLMNFNNVKSLKPYILVGFILWLCILQSGVHATIAGVLLAFAVPLSIDNDEHCSPLKRLEHILYPWAAFVIMPIFAFANAGFSLHGISLATLAGTLPLGIMLGLFFGKQFGVFGFVWFFDKIGVIQRPQVSWRQLYGLCILTGIGFTVSLFIGSLAFTDPLLLSEVRLSVLLASAFSAIVGYKVLSMKEVYASRDEANINPIAHPEVFSEDHADNADSRAER